MAVNPTAVWRVRPAGSNTNGAGFDTGITGFGTDYSKQDAAQLSVADATSVAASKIVLSVTGGFTAAMIGNAIYLSGTHFTTGWYFITAWTSTNSITIDRDPTTGGNGSLGTLNVGGGWADFWTNTTSAKAALVPGNIVYILGSGVPNPAAYTIDYSPAVTFTPTSGDQTNGIISFIGDPATPSSGVPCIQPTGQLFSGAVAIQLQNLWFVGGGTTNNSNGIFACSSPNFTCLVSNVVYDQFGYDIGWSGHFDTGVGACNYFNMEVFNTHAARGTTGQPGINISDGSMINCNIHDCLGDGIASTGPQWIVNTISAKNGNVGIRVYSTLDSYSCAIMNCTVDANGGIGIYLNGGKVLGYTCVLNCIISNHASSPGLEVAGAAGTQAQVDKIKGFIDYNIFYNNAGGNYHNITAGGHDTAEGTNPYVGQSTENYTLA